MAQFAARTLYLLAAIVGRLPWPWLRRAANAMAGLLERRSTREVRVTETNLELAYPELLPGQRLQMRQAILRSTTLQVLETLRLWTRPRQENLSLIVEQHGAHLLDEAIAAGKGVIIAAPHYGNWELLNQWLASRTPLAILYAPPDSKVGEAFLNLVRADEDAARITQVRADGAGVRQLLRYAAGGGVVGILPDQQPKLGEGEFAPFFGKPALTMTLIGRLAARSGATVLMGYCERIDSRRSPRFALHLEAAPPEAADRDPAVSVAALNAAIERIARRDPTQYQWTYKRYSLRPPGSGEKNPYWPYCYRGRR
ncbi:lauroyl acyltransferase [Novilysobacter spongiicola]|uniref:KDO2-lipid IV(A) lauroyltransferase n=1 Tax=Lysobacter spongiicola DSM 21749 TaxID=1122188 RepID=A0A1T4PPJ0_9GAMM|nr:lauroyl acyltransferase [Lysobacter spongiicola]SJZ93463.1 KDO2-lipid IV(A) lauroyltransferase [Lysobacter spongiicola DSM 21749]